VRQYMFPTPCYVIIVTSEEDSIMVNMADLGASRLLFLAIYRRFAFFFYVFW
jgi:hypothetical protein